MKKLLVSLCVLAVLVMGLSFIVAGRAQTAFFHPQAVTKTATNYTVQASDAMILVDTSGGAVQITLPKASQGTRELFGINLSTNNVIVTNAGPDQINGKISLTNNTQLKLFRFQPDGNTNWYVL